MRVPLSWLSDYVRTDLGVEQLAERLTLGGLVVDAILRPTAGVRGVRVAQVRSVSRMEGSDKLSLVVADDGDDVLEVVCGASNFSAGDRVAWAKPGAQLPSGDPANPLRLGRKKLFGVVSNGMLASPRELGIGEDHRGIWVLDPDAPIGADLAEWLDLDDPVLDLDINPDRGYALSVLGVARDVAALTGAELRVPEAPDPAVGDAGVTVAIEDPEACPRFSVTRVDGVRVGPSPAWLQRRLAAAGMRSVSNVVDATNHAMLETGHPAHAYDLARIVGGRLEVRAARDGETLVTLDGEQRALVAGDLVIADGDGPVGLAGVMGGARTEVGDTTGEVLVEVAAFAPAAVLRTARRLQLFTEASSRFEKTVPERTVPFGASRCAALLGEVAGGTVGATDDRWPRPAQRPVIRLRTDRVRRHLGIDLPDARQAELLASLACEVAVAADAVLAVTPPDYRPDLRLEVDLDEEIARLEGYERIGERVPSSGRAGGRSPEHAARRRVREALAGGGWTEVLTFPFLATADFDALNLAPDDVRRRPVALVNPLSKSEAVLRTTMLPGLLRSVRANANRQSGDLALFEVGAVFLPPSDEEPGAGGGPPSDPRPPLLPAEPLMLALAACGDFLPARHDQSGRAADLFDLLGAADLARRVIGREELTAEPTSDAPYHPGRAARLRLGGVDIGVVGELHPRVVAALEVPARTVAGELRLDRLTAGGITLAAATEPSPLPPLRFDVAVVVDGGVPAAAVESAVRRGAGPRVTSCELFDVYAGPSVGEGRKSLAYRLRLDDPERGLTEADQREVLESISSAVADGVGGALRR